MSIDNPEHWRPNMSLLAEVRTQGLTLADLSGTDRTWIVASLTMEGWTVASIADRLSCSRRTIQYIKSEPATHVAWYALSLEHDLRELLRMGL